MGRGFDSCIRLQCPLRSTEGQDSYTVHKGVRLSQRVLKGNGMSVLPNCEKCGGRGWVLDTDKYRPDTPDEDFKDMDIKECPNCHWAGCAIPHDALCKCGHTLEEHHRVSYPGYVQTADECEFYGHNETGGMEFKDGKWVDHCHDFTAL